MYTNINDWNEALKGNVNNAISLSITYPVLIDTGMAVAQIGWNHTGSMMAVTELKLIARQNKGNWQGCIQISMIESKLWQENVNNAIFLSIADPVLIDTGMAVAQIGWNHTGSLMALAEFQLIAMQIKGNWQGCIQISTI